MTINSTLFKAILSFDSYNRGYDAFLKFGNEAGNNSVDQNGIKIGTDCEASFRIQIFFEQNSAFLSQNILP